MGCQIRGACAKHATEEGDTSGDDVAIGKFAKTERDIHVLLKQVADAIT